MTKRSPISGVLAEVLERRLDLDLSGRANFAGPYPSDKARHLLTAALDAVHTAELSGLASSREDLLSAAVGDALVQREPEALRKALVQVAAVAVAWAEHLDREGRR